MTNPAASPLDQALQKRPRGKPRAGLPPAPPVPAWPIDLDPRLSRTDRATKALGDIQSVWTKFKEMADGPMPRAELARHADAAMKRVSKAIDETNTALVADLGGLRDRIDAALTPRVEPALAVQIRDHHRALSTTARFERLRAAIEAGDSTTVSAVLGAPPYLSGLDDAAMATLRAAAERKVAPDLAAQRDRTERDLALMRRAAERLVATITPLVAGWQQDEAKLAEFRDGREEPGDA
jgi:hypothetical protein